MFAGQGIDVLVEFFLVGCVLVGGDCVVLLADLVGVVARVEDGVVLRGLKPGQAEVGTGC